MIKVLVEVRAKKNSTWQRLDCFFFPYFFERKIIMWPKSLVHALIIANVINWHCQTRLRSNAAATKDDFCAKVCLRL